MELSVNDLIERMKSIQPLKNFESIGFSQNTINNWKFRNVFPKSDDLYKISQFLNVSIDWLLTGNINEISGNEATLLENYRSLDPTGKRHVDLMVEALAGK